MARREGESDVSVDVILSAFRGVDRFCEPREEGMEGPVICIHMIFFIFMKLGLLAKYLAITTDQLLLQGDETKARF
ncbi:hypothetical protein HanPSC8_Chr09g0365451 [Helianthus annuus]|nr:hypothetical protein HanPSC8_Chr09g0365451 [Helianthus annuus]